MVSFILGVTAGLIVGLVLSALAYKKGLKELQQIRIKEAELRDRIALIKAETGVSIASLTSRLEDATSRLRNANKAMSRIAKSKGYQVSVDRESRGKVPVHDHLLEIYKEVKTIIGDK